MTDNIIKGAKEAAEIASGDKPAARIRINGHTYVPEDRALQVQGREWGMGYEHGLKQGRLQGRAQGLEEAAQLARNFTTANHVAQDIKDKTFPEQSPVRDAIARAIEALKEQTND